MHIPSFTYIIILKIACEEYSSLSTEKHRFLCTQTYKILRNQSVYFLSLIYSIVQIIKSHLFIDPITNRCNISINSWNSICTTTNSPCYNTCLQVYIRIIITWTNKGTSSITLEIVKKKEITLLIFFFYIIEFVINFNYLTSIFIRLSTSANKTIIKNKIFS